MPLLDSAGMAHSHYTCLETEALIGTTLELIERQHVMPFLALVPQ